MASENNRTAHQYNIQIVANPVFYFKQIKETEVHNINILAAFNRKLGEALETDQGIPLDYGFDLWDPTGISNLFHHHEDREKKMECIQKGSQYHQSPIYEVTSK